jgi:hypothetical protein
MSMVEYAIRIGGSIWNCDEGDWTCRWDTPEAAMLAKRLHEEECERFWKSIGKKPPKVKHTVVFREVGKWQTYKPERSGP